MVITKKKLNQQEFLDALKFINPNVKIVGNYINMATKIKVECLIDGNTWDAKPRKLLKGVGCRICSSRNNGMTHVLSDIDYKAIIKAKNPNIEIVGKYINATTKVRARCLLDGHVWETYPCALRTSGCPKCAGAKKSQSQLHTHDEFVNALRTTNPNVDVIGTYLGVNMKVEVRCIKHGIIWHAYPNNLRKGSGCSLCWQEKTLASSKKGGRIAAEVNLLSMDQVVEKLNTKNPNIKLVGPYTGVGKKASFRCEDCGHQWSTTFSVIAGGCGCPNCSSTKGESFLKSALESIEVEYIYQHQFLDCKYKNPLKFDFYLPSKKTAIEYQGEQHYRPVDFAGKGEKWAMDQFNINQIRDQIKREYCSANGIRLIEIPYFEIDNIPNVVHNIFDSTPNGISA